MDMVPVIMDTLPATMAMDTGMAINAIAPIVIKDIIAAMDTEGTGAMGITKEEDIRNIKLINEDDAKRE